MGFSEVQQDILCMIPRLQERPNLYVEDYSIAARLELDLQEVRDHLELLEEEHLVDLAKSHSGFSAMLTARGRMTLREPSFRQMQLPPPTINILAMFDSKIENLVQAGSGSTVIQKPDFGPDEHLLRIVQQMVDVVSTSQDVEKSVKQDYALEAEQLKAELRKSRINLSRVREMLSFLADADGLLGLATRLAPFLVVLEPYIGQLLSAV